VAVLHPQAAERYRWQVAHLHDSIRSADPPAREIVALVRGMIETIKVRPAAGKMELTVVGNLASFLVREQEGNTISTALVAGVGFESTTFRL
jgi:hypothetical protein